MRLERGGIEEDSINKWMRGGSVFISLLFSLEGSLTWENFCIKKHFRCNLDFYLPLGFGFLQCQKIEVIHIVMDVVKVLCISTLDLVNILATPAFG